jgi:hypothetical protein
MQTGKHLGKAALLASILGLAAGSVTQAQTCGTSLSCTLTGNAFSVTNNGQALFGQTRSTANDAAGIFGTDGSGPTCHVLSHNPPAGVRGESASYVGVAGRSAGIAGVAGYFANSQCFGDDAFGYLGAKVGTKTYGVYSGGDIGGTGAKYFIEPHPTDASKEIRYVSLEGPEAGTYFRGSARTVHGRATIQVPESFRMVTDEKGLTVVVTPVGEMAQIAVVRRSLDSIVVQSSKDVEFDYMVNGFRRAFRDFEPISENSSFVPTGPNDTRFFSLPLESRNRLVATGIYTPEGKVNLVKAHEMGWDQRWADHGQGGEDEPPNR